MKKGLTAALLVAVLAALLTPATGAAAAPDDFAGVVASDRVVHGTNEDIPNDLDPMRAAAVRHIRLAFDWERIEPQPGVYSMGRYDRIVAAAAFRGFRVLPMLIDAPPFHTAETQGARPGLHPPLAPVRFKEFAQLMAHRYGAGGAFWAEYPWVPYLPIRSWQIWNEPNLRAFWPSGPDPAEYTRLLQAGHDGIKASDPTAEIVTAGLPDSGGSTLGQFLDGMYAAGARGYFDTLAVHPYGADSAEVMEGIGRARDALVRHSDPRPLWVSEFGWATSGDQSRWTTTPNGQALRIRATLRAIERERETLGIRAFTYYHWRDSPGQDPGSLWSGHAGLIGSDWKAKPGYFAYAETALDLWGPTPGVAPGEGAPPGGVIPDGDGGGAGGGALDGGSGRGDGGGAGDGGTGNGIADDKPGSPARPAWMTAGVSAPETFTATPARRAADLERMQSAGVEIVRQRFDWRALEPARGRYELAAFDGVVTAAARRGIRVLPVITRVRAASDPAGLRRLADALARRYGPGGALWREYPDLEPLPVRSWQIGDAPNDPKAWGAKPNPARYVRLLDAARDGITGRDADAEIVTAELSESRRATAPRRYLKAMYRAHRTPWDTVGTAAWADGSRGVVTELVALRRLMDQAGHARGAIWLTGTGWADRGKGGVGASGQASRIRALFKSLAGRRSLGLRGIVYRGWRGKTGLVDSSGRPKRALTAFREAAAELRRQQRR
jgi:hypothetical protein